MKRFVSLLALSVLFGGAPAFADTRTECVDHAEQGQRKRLQKKLTEARPLLVQCASDACPSVVREDCVTWLAAVDASVPSVVVRARDAAGRDATDVRVLVDGVEVTKHLTGAAMEIDPGEHRFRFEPAGKAATEQTVLVVEGEKGRIVAVELPSDPSAALVPAGEGGASKSSLAPWIVTGVGAAGILTFGVLEVLIQTEHADLKDGCGATRSCTEDEVSGTETKVTMAAIALGVGVVGLGIGIPWLLLDRKSAPTPPRGAAIEVGAGGIRGRF